MAMTISGSTGVTYPDGSSQSSGQQACKAWVNFNGTGTVAIRASFNVSSITDNGTGDYTVNITTALADTNYCAIGHITQTAVTTEVVTWAARVIDVSTSAIRMRCGLQGATSGSAADNEFVRLVVFR